MSQVEDNSRAIKELARDAEISRASQVFGIFHCLCFVTLFVGLWIVAFVSTRPQTHVRMLVEHISGGGLGLSLTLLYYRVRLFLRAPKKSK